MACENWELSSITEDRAHLYCNDNHDLDSENVAVLKSEISCKVFNCLEEDRPENVTLNQLDQDCSTLESSENICLFSQQEPEFGLDTTDKVAETINETSVLPEQAEIETRGENTQLPHCKFDFFFCLKDLSPLIVSKCKKQQMHFLLLLAPFCTQIPVQGPEASSRKGLRSYHNMDVMHFCCCSALIKLFSGHQASSSHLSTLFDCTG